MRRTSCLGKDHAKVLIAGGGTAGTAVANHFSRKLGISKVAIIDGSATHYYQPGFTLLSGNLIDQNSIVRKRSDYLPNGIKWYQSGVQEFTPNNNSVLLQDGTLIGYDYLIVALGIDIRYDLIRGLPESLHCPEVCSIYTYDLAKKTRDLISGFKGGTALFTFPSTPLKCAGAPLKVCNLADDIFRANGVRNKTKIIYNTPTGKIFGVEKYAKVLQRLADEKNIILNKRHALVEVKGKNRIAVFDVLDDEGKSVGRRDEIQYDFLHVGPPCSPVEALRLQGELTQQGAASLTDEKGWVKVDPKTLQNPDFPNVFAIGDCANTSNGKTAAAISSQFKALKTNLGNVINGKPCTAEYDGYASCPLLVDRRHVILAEFNADGPLETLPIDQSRPSILNYILKRYLMPPLYWLALVRGYWNGPATIRKICHFGFGK